MEFTACSSPQDYLDLAPGNHSFEVRAVDAAGNRDATPASRSWTIDTSAPETTIDSGPADPTNSTSASFGFSSDDPAAGFECKLDGAAEFTACGSPQDYLDLAPGNHTFEVRAVDSAGVRDPSPASRSWTIDTNAPNTTIDQGPADPTSSTSASFHFSADESGASFECKLDDAADFSPCSSPKEYQDLSPGSHTLLVRATDAVGSTDPSPASHSWTVSPILFQDSSFAANSTASTLEIPKPTQVAVGDQMVATIAVRAGPAVTPPAGWFRVREDVNGNAVKLVTYRNRVGQNEPSSFTWTFSTAHAAAGGIVAYRGVRSVAPVDISGGQANAQSTSLTAPSITTTVANARLIGLYATPVATSIEPPTGMIERGEASSTAGIRKMTVAVADAARGAAGPTGASIAVAGLAALNVGQHVALAPAAP